MTKLEIMDKLSALGIPFDSSKTKAELEVLLPADQVTPEDPAPVAAPETTEAIDGIEVADPQLLRPVDLPLVVKPTSGKWKNEAQERFALTLNGYAYRNPTKWESKKAALLKQLSDLAENPSKIFIYEGGANGNISYKDKRFQQ